MGEVWRRGRRQQCKPDSGKEAEREVQMYCCQGGKYRGTAVGLGSKTLILLPLNMHSPGFQATLKALASPAQHAAWVGEEGLRYSRIGEGASCGQKSGRHGLHSTLFAIA